MKTVAEYYDSKKCHCGGDIVLVEYGYNVPERYDGWSEIMCTACKFRIGRWTGKELKDGQLEPRWGETK